MRLLNSVCKIISSKFEGVPIHIEQMPKGFTRPCFLVSLVTSSSDLLNYNVYNDIPIYQIVYFGECNEANQVNAEPLYTVKEELKALFLLKKAIPILPKEGVKEKPRYAKIDNYSDELRLSENCIYTKIAINFTEDIPKPEYELMQSIDIETKIQG